MALRRSIVLEFGGFDGSIRPSAEDNDLSYRWLRAGRRIRYEPDFVVWHHDWRTRDQLARLYVGYGIGQGMVYGKHLRRGDVIILRHLAASLHSASRGVVARLVRGAPAQPDPRLGMLRGLPTGLLRGWRARWCAWKLTAVWCATEPPAAATSLVCRIRSSGLGWCTELERQRCGSGTVPRERRSSSGRRSSRPATSSDTVRRAA